MKKHLSGSKNPLSVFLTKGIAIIAIVTVVILYTDHKGYFEADNLNNHTLRKWNSFYSLTSKNKVDIVLVGNSHLYTGLNPKNLSEALGITSFILASPGTNIADSYYCLEEAIETCKPQIAIVETYGIGDFILDSLTPPRISDQIKSFSARRNTLLKLLSTPALFNSDSWGYAWSSTIRNHNFLLTNPEQIQKNRMPAPRQPQSLYLGRYVRWTTGIESPTLEKYKTLGAPVDGSNYTYSEDAAKYVKKIVDLCQEKHVKLIFLTLPMYYQHIKDYNHWKTTLSELLSPYHWLDLQEPYDYRLFDTDCFENSYETYQHMTYQGSLVSAYKLAEYIEEKYGAQLQRQDRNPYWHQLFYGDEGYFENYPPHPQDKYNSVLMRDTIINSISIKEIDILKNNKYQSLLIKISRQQEIPEILDSRVNVIATIKQNNQIQDIRIEAPHDKLHRTLKHHLYVTNIPPNVEIVKIKEISL